MIFRRLRSLLIQKIYIFFLLPALILYITFIVYPLISSFRYSLYDWKGVFPDRFVWFNNFKKLLLETPYNERLFNALKHNLFFFLTTMIVQNTVGLFLALILFRGLRGSSIYQTIFFMPVTLSIVVVGFLWTLILNPTWGVFNKLLVLVGLKSLARPWLGDTATALPTIIMVNAWHWIGFPLLVFLAGMQSIPEEYIEAAKIDGAGELQVISKIVLPLIAPTITIVTILTFIGNFNAFDIIYAMEGTQGGPYYSTDVLATFFYRTAFGEAGGGGGQDIGFGSAIAVVMFIIISTASFIGATLLRRREVEY